MRILFVACSLLPIILAIPAVAQVATGETSAMSATKPAPKVNPNKSICRTFDTTGSRLGKRRECRTAGEWAEQSALDRREVERQQASRWKQD